MASSSLCTSFTLNDFKSNLRVVPKIIFTSLATTLIATTSYQPLPVNAADLMSQVQKLQEVVLSIQSP